MLFATFYYYLFAPQFHPSKTVYIYVDRDDTADSIYHKIKEFGHVNKFTGFQWMAKYKDFNQNIHTGRYAIRPNDNVYHVYSRFSRGYQEPMNLTIGSVRTPSDANFRLQTTEIPYGWTIYLDDAFTKKQQTTVEKTMKNYAMVILACTKNLGSVTFSYTLDGKTTDFTYTKEQGENEFLGTCNYFRSSATEFQTLLAKTGILSDPVFSRLSGNQGYRLTEQLNNVPDAEITGTIQNEKQNIIKQYESYLPTNSWSPGSISKSFSSEKDALAYIGYKNLRSFALPQKADSISVNATADKKGNICYISLSELYSCADGQINVTAAADLYTESSNIGSYIDMDYPSYEETPDAVSTNELYTTASGDTWQLITTTSQGDDFNDSIDAYRTEDTILYGIHIGYPSNLKESAQAELKKILENGIDQN